MKLVHAVNGAGARSGAPLDSSLIGRVHAAVGEVLTQRHASDGEAGRPRMSRADERALTRELIADELAGLANEAYEAGRDPLDDEPEAALAGPSSTASTGSAGCSRSSTTPTSGTSTSPATTACGSRCAVVRRPAGRLSPTPTKSSSSSSPPRRAGSAAASAGGTTLTPSSTCRCPTATASTLSAAGALVLGAIGWHLLRRRRRTRPAPKHSYRN